MTDYYVTAMRDLAADLAVISRETDVLADKQDITALADALYMLRERRKALSDLERHIEAQVADLMGTQDALNLDDQLTLERRRGSERKQWQSDEIVSALWTRSFAGNGNGEFDPDGQPERFLDAVKACVPLTPSLSWRAGALREHGLDPDEYADVKPGRVSVAVHRQGEKT